jgi:hypothetical protein
MSISDRYSFNESEHIHTLDGKPLVGTSSVMGIVAKPLTWWASAEAVKTLGWTHPKYTNNAARETAAAKIKTVIEKQTLTDYIKLLDDAYAAHSKTLSSSATKGKNLHAQLEKYVKFCIKKNEGSPMNVKDELIQDFIEWSIENVDQFLWSEMHVYSEVHWLGGISDCGARLKNGKVIIIDFKSSKEAYPTQFWQCAGYQIQIEENGGFTPTGDDMIKPMPIDAHVIIPFGAEKFTVSTDNDTIANKASFLAALHLYREQKRLSGE